MFFQPLFCFEIQSDQSNQKTNQNVRTRQRRQDQGQGKVPFQPCWTSVPCWTYPPPSPQGKLCWPSWSWCPSLLGCCHVVLGCCHVVLGCWGPWVGRQCCPWQQEDLLCHLQLAIHNDKELNKLIIAGVTIAQCGVLPNIQAAQEDWEGVNYLSIAAWLKVAYNSITYQTNLFIHSFCTYWRKNALRRGNSSSGHIKNLSNVDFL